MSDAKVGALELEGVIDKLPQYYAFFDDRSELVMIGPDHPQYSEAKASFEKRLKRMFR